MTTTMMIILMMMTMWPPFRHCLFRCRCRWHCHQNQRSQCRRTQIRTPVKRAPKTRRLNQSVRQSAPQTASVFSSVKNGSENSTRKERKEMNWTEITINRTNITKQTKIQHDKMIKCKNPVMHSTCNAICTSGSGVSASHEFTTTSAGNAYA